VTEIALLSSASSFSPNVENAVVDPRHEPDLLRIQPARIARRVDCLDPREQRLVERDRIRRPREFRRPFAVELLVCGRVHVAGHHAEQRHHLPVAFAGELHRHDRVGEGRLGRIVRDLAIVRGALGERRLECLRKQLGANLVPRRHSAQRTGPVGQ
jgi:hypothetical protein